MRINFSALMLMLCILNAKSQTCPNLGWIKYQEWDSIPGTSISDLTTNQRYPNNPSANSTLTSFAIPANSGKNNYGIKIFGYICPPVTGTYFFWIAADDAGELWLSNSSKPGGKVKIAYNTHAVAPLQWSKYSTQKSKPVLLTQGNKYYVEALVKQATAGDNLAVGWSQPGQSTDAPAQIIPGSVLSIDDTGADTIPPTAPSTITAPNITTTSITINWFAATDNIGVTGYNIFQDGIKINKLAIADSTFTLKGLTDNKGYAITVQAMDAAGNTSMQSNVFYAKTKLKDTSAPTAPSALAASNITTNSFTLSWAASVDNVGVAGYNIYKNGTKLNNTSIVGTLFNLTNLKANMVYTITAKAIDSAKNLSLASAALVVATNKLKDTIPPSKPTKLVATNITSTSFTLSWGASKDNEGVAGYDIYRNGVKINSKTMLGTSFSVTGCSPNTKYSITVIAKDSTGNQSNTSPAVNIITIATTSAQENFTMRTIIAKQRMPFDLVYGPDNNIWYTERLAGTVSFVNPITGVKKIVLTLGQKMAQRRGADGLMGLALHPQFRQGKPWVYIAYTYLAPNNTRRSTRIERYNYDSISQQLISPVTVLENIPGSNDHNGGRIAIGPDLKLYYTVGDMGAGQLENQNRRENAQNIDTLEGKILRLNTEVTEGTWIPADNPFKSSGTGQQTPVYTLGHRHPQGLVWANVGGTSILYSSEHGAYSDDEINIIERGRNYGWPEVSGFCDGNYNGDTLGNFLIINEQANCALLNVKEPLRSIFPAETPPTVINTNNMLWPSMAPSGTEFYGSNAIPGWQNSLLVATLKGGTVIRYKLSNDGTAIISDTINYFKGLGRFRDVVVSPDGLKIYVACDSSGPTFGPGGIALKAPPNPGSILEFTYVPGKVASPSASIEQAIKLPDNDVSNKSLDVYPNPASQFVVVYNYSLEFGRTALLYDLNGRMVKKQLLSQKSTIINVANLSNGLYLLRVLGTDNKVVRVEKIIINH